MKPKPRVFSTMDEFREAMKATEGQAPADTRVRASLETDVKAKEGAERTLVFTISTASVDRMGDTIAVEGWHLEAFRKNPVVLWAHDSGSLPVAKAPKIWIEGQKLMSEAEFTPAGMARFNDTVFEMYKQGFLSATSVGFLPLKYAFTDDPKRRFGIDFLEQELLEFSAVPVPANAEALIEGRAAGIDIAPVLDWCEDAIRRAGDQARIIKLVENTLGSSNDLFALAWAERVLAASGKSVLPPGAIVISRERAEAIAGMEKAMTRARLGAKRRREVDVLRLRGEQTESP